MRMLLLLLLSALVAHGAAHISIGESILEERVNGRLERVTSESLGGDVLVMRNMVFRYYSERGFEILSTTYTCRRAEPKANSWRVETVVECFYDPAVKSGRIFHSWSPRRVAELPLMVSRCNVVGRNVTVLADRKSTRAGHHSWEVKVPTDPYPTPVFFECIAWPEKGPKMCRLTWKVEMASGTFTPNTDPPTGHYCSHLGGIGLLTVSWREP